MPVDITPDENGYTYGSNTQVTNTPQARLADYMRNPGRVASKAPDMPSGVANPYGTGLSAYEPNTTPWIEPAQTGEAMKTTTEQTQTGADSMSLDSPHKQGQSAAAMVPQGDFASGGVADANGLVQKMINAALSAASHNVPYVWGGTNLATGVDCSGLIFAAAQAAGLKWQRYVASDYGRMGTAVSMAQARPGDVVYYDEGGGAGHVGLYLGNGMMVAAPQTGENVKVQRVYGTPTSIRRIFNDSSFTPTALPGGGMTYAYNGRPMATPGATPFSANPITPPPPPPPSLYSAAVTSHGGMSRPI